MCVCVCVCVCVWATYMGNWKDKVGKRSRIFQKDLELCDAWRVHAVTKLCPSIIIGKSMVSNCVA